MDVSTDEITERRKPRIVVKEGSIVPRKGHTQKRDVLADPLYNNKVVTKLINNIMLDGKKGVAQKIVYGAFNKVEEKTGKPAVEVFEEAMNNVMPVLEVKAKRIGGATYQVPIEVKPERRQALALRWLTMFSRKRGEKTQEERLANRFRCKEKGRYAQDGRGKQGVCSLSFLIVALSDIYSKLRRKKSWLEENIHWREPEILELWLISMQVRLL